jgi:hypothetical protein
MFFFSPETKSGNEIMRKILNFASFEAKKFSPSFCFEAKITISKRSEKFKAKKSEKSEKKRKNAKKSKKIDMNFASLRFASKRKLLKRSEAKNLKRQ